MTLKNIITVITLAVALAACSSQPPLPGQKLGKPYEIDGTTYYPEYDSTYDKIGVASWYGPGFHGKYTANGEVFNQNDLTAAHPTLPMPSIVRVTNLENGKSAIIRINDRGPFKDRRIIDLSKRSAQELGVKTLSKVRVQFLKPQTEEYLASVKKGSPIQVAKFNEREEDIKDASILQSTQPDEQIVESTVSVAHAGESVADSAPLMTVSSRELDAPGGAPSATPSTLQKPEKGQEVKIVSLVKDGWADDNMTMPTAPEQAQTEPQEERVPQLTPSVEKPATLKPAARKADAEPVFTGPGYFIQVGSFSAEENANKLVSRLSDIGHVGIDKVEVSNKSWWRVRLGPYNARETAESALKKVRDAGLAEARLIHP